MGEGFTVSSLPLPSELFEQLSASALLEPLGKGRQGAVLTRVDEQGRAPLVRTTTCYSAPAQRFAAAHLRLAQQLRERAGLAHDFNNALFEKYTGAYTSMAGHSDQALDLAEDSSIAVFSCYQQATGPVRELVVEAKSPGAEPFTVPLLHHHVVVFSLETNRQHRHKIVLPSSARSIENPWLGITFRTSRTLVRFDDGRARFLDGSPLTLADEDQRREFLQLRARENRETEFAYPPISYTLSASDLVPPGPLRR